MGVRGLSSQRQLYLRRTQGHFVGIIFMGFSDLQLMTRPKLPLQSYQR